MFSCCPESPHHVQYLSRVAVAEGDSVFCPHCRGGRRDHVDVGWFQRLCHINGVEWPVPPQVTCVLCMDSMGEDRVACNQEVHVGCLAQSFNACGARCPFCVQQLREFAESPGFQAAALFHGHSVDVSGQPTNRGTNSLVLPSGFPSPPEHLSLLCCSRVGSSTTVRTPTDAWSGLQCGSSRLWFGIAMDLPRCQTRVESSLQEVRRTWFSHGPLAGVGPLCGWGEHPITVPGQGPQIVVVLPDQIIGIGCRGACTRCDTVLSWAAQSCPTGAATILDDTRSRNCGFFGRPFPVSFPPSLKLRKSCRISPLGWVVNISQASNKNCVFHHRVGFFELMVGDPVLCSSSFSQPFLEHAGQDSSGQSSIHFRAQWQIPLTQVVQAQAVHLLCPIHL